MSLQHVWHRPLLHVSYLPIQVLKTSLVWSGYLEKVSIKQSFIFSNSRSLERPGLIIESLEYVHKIVKTKIIVPKTSFRLTENFLADAFAFL